MTTLLLKAWGRFLKGLKKRWKTLTTTRAHKGEASY